MTSDEEPVTEYIIPVSGGRTETPASMEHH